MNIEELRDYCMCKKHVEEYFPFDEKTLVFKVKGKVFLLTDIQSNPLQFNVKCDPEIAIQLRENYSCITPGFHMNKKHWNTIICDGSLPKTELIKWIDHSYDLVYSGLSKKAKQQNNY
jgi:predicted DNA-binding protein (MmcQ/YjbR family)